MIRYLKFGAPHFSHGSEVKMDGKLYRMEIVGSGEGGEDCGHVVAFASRPPAHPQETIFLSRGRFGTVEEAKDAANTQFPISEETDDAEDREKAVDAIVKQLNAEIILGD